MHKFKEGQKVSFKGNPGIVVSRLPLSGAEREVPHYTVALDRLGMNPETHVLAESNLEERE